MQITYTKAIVDLIKEIRYRLHADLKPSIKLANPDVLNELINHYQESEDVITKALIKELMLHCGSEWKEKFVETTKQHYNQKSNTKVYRGVITVEETKTTEKKGKEK